MRIISFEYARYKILRHLMTWEKLVQGNYKGPYFCQRISKPANITQNFKKIIDCSLVFQSVLVEHESKSYQHLTTYPLLAQRSIFGWTRHSMKSILILVQRQANTIQLMIRVKFFLLDHNLLTFFLVKFNTNIKYSYLLGDYFVTFVTESIIFLIYHK